MLQTLSFQNKRVIGFELLLMLVVIFILSAVLICKPASAAVAGLTFDGTEYINNASTDQNATVNPYIDSTLGT